ncbi:FecR family protein [Chondrinema litorale]|uniref:FecR family protein n=1 Tax=Chondrinema litorale TaxID=2994555 RepID=UPI0025437941|nr:FecR family protein [Chondrinema litorale]UZR97306.1 FecR family protein [Chondrinema litorale]
MMDYKDFQLEHFLTDSFFISWVKKPDTASEHFWLNWLQNNPEKEELITEARKIILKSRYKYMYQPTEQDYLQVLEKIHQRNYSSNHRYTKPKINWYMLSAAAVIVILLAVTVILNPFQNETSIVQEKSVPQKIIRSVPNGKKLQFNLPDGSQVKINSGSTLWYMSDYNNPSRDVYLKGEAFFDVTPNPEKPFKVHVDKIVTKVLGTAFNIRAYDDDHNISVSVAEGKVSVYNNENNKVVPEISSGNMAIYKADIGSFEEQEVDIEKVIAWKNNTIVLEKASCKEVFEKLEKWYGVKFITKEDLGITGKFNGKFHDTSLKDVLTGLDFSSQIDFELKNDTVWCSKKDLPMK